MYSTAILERMIAPKGLAELLSEDEKVCLQFSRCQHHKRERLLKFTVEWVSQAKSLYSAKPFSAQIPYLLHYQRGNPQGLSPAFENADENLLKEPAEGVWD